MVKRLNAINLFMQIAVVSVVAAGTLLYVRSPAESFTDLWLTHDQQAMRLYTQGKYAEAAERFDNVGWKGSTQYRIGLYVDAAESFGRIPSAVGFYNRGNAFMRAFEYRKAIRAYEQAVAEAPDWPEAQENLGLARYTLDYIERAREQGDTGEKSGIGADDIVYDNESGRGAETEVSRDSAVEAQSAEKWMRSVNTETADFLRSRFLLESLRREQP